MCWGTTRKSTDPGSGIDDNLLTFYTGFFSYSHNITFLFPARDEFDEYGDLTTPKKLCAPGLEGLPEISEILTGEKKSLSDEVLFLVGVRLKWDIYRDFGSRARIGRTLENTGSSVCYVDTEKTDKAIRTFHQKLINEIGGFKKLTISGVGRFIRDFLYHVRTRGGIAHEDTERYIMADGFGKLLGRDESISRLIPRKRSWGNLPAYPCSKGVPDFDSLAGTRPERTWYGKWAICCFKPINPHIFDYIKELYEFCTAALIENNILIKFTTNKGKKVWGIDQSVLRLTSAAPVGRSGKKKKAPEEQKPLHTSSCPTVPLMTLTGRCFCKKDMCPS